MRAPEKNHKGPPKKEKEKEKETEKELKLFCCNVGSSTLLAYQSFWILQTLLFLLAETIGGKEREALCILCYLFGTKSTMSGPHYFTVHRRKVIRQVGMEDMSPLDVEEFCMGILDSGARMASRWVWSTQMLVWLTMPCLV
jgi:hypothetical protein